MQVMRRAAMSMPWLWLFSACSHIIRCGKNYSICLSLFSGGVQRREDKPVGSDYIQSGDKQSVV